MSRVTPTLAAEDVVLHPVPLDGLLSLVKSGYLLPHGTCRADYLRLNFSDEGSQLTLDIWMVFQQITKPGPPDHRLLSLSLLQICA